MSDDLQRFKDAWQAMVQQHRNWSAAAASGATTGTSAYSSNLQRQYEAVQLAAGNLIADAESAANNEADAGVLWAKIDRSFICTMVENPDSQTIVDAVLGLARNLGMPVVAEGIETPHIMKLLADSGCAYGQGFLFSQAVPTKDASDMLIEQTPVSLLNEAS